MDQQVATVKKIINIWEDGGGIEAIRIFLSESKVYENTWAEKIKKLIDQNIIKSVEAEIELVSFNINLEKKLYKNKKDDKSGESSCNCK